MPDQEQFPDSDRLARFLRESIDDFMDRLDIKERNSDTHDEQVHYEEWVRFCLVTSPAPPERRPRALGSSRPGQSYEPAWVQVPCPKRSLTVETSWARISASPFPCCRRPDPRPRQPCAGVPAPFPSPSSFLLEARNHGHAALSYFT